MVIIFNYFGILALICWEFEAQEYVPIEYQSDKNINYMRNAIVNP